MSTSITPKHLWIISGAFWLAACGMAMSCSFFFQTPEVALRENEKPKTASPPSAISHSFQQRLLLQEALDSSSFKLASIDRPIRLPDLRNLLVFYGSNDRPDCSLTSRRLQFGLRGSPTISSAQTGQEIFFKFDTRTSRWVISETSTPLTAVFAHQDPNAQVTLTYKEGNGVSVTVPQEFHQFSLSPVPPPASANQTHQWLIGSLPVDGSLLERQGAMWWGQDEVVQALGGDEMAYEACRQRVQFGIGESSYVIWVGEGDCFVYDDDRWNAATPGEETLGKPFLKAKSIDGRAMHFLLWNPEGTSHLSVDLVHREASGEVKVPEIKIIGARSKRQWIAEIQGKRLTLTPDDWVLLKSDGFVQLDSPELLDEYLQGRLAGNLLVFSGIEKVDGELCLVGVFYDSTRTRHDTFSISLYRSWGKKERTIESVAADDDDLDEDEDGDDDDGDDDDEIVFDEDENDEE